MIQTLFGEPPKPSLFERLSEKVAGAVEKTRDQLVAQVEDLFQGNPTVRPELLRQLEATLVSADLGARTAADIVARVRQQLEQQRGRDANTSAEAVRAAIKAELVAIFDRTARPPRETTDGAPFVILLVGVNGAGKTTSIGKLAQRYKSEGFSSLICAGDTFRAAATEQVAVWAERAGVELVQQKPGADPSAVLFDALAAAKSRHVNYVLVDTAGRLHTKTNLMQELAKMRRTAERQVPGAPHETLLVLDATTGQNGLQQARQFTQAAALTGLIVTKLDGTARGGIVVAIARELGLPVRYLGVGERAEDLIPFEPGQFVDALLGASSGAA
ncbi:MAG TPA: signal recognition particle-docking protein FtsY [Terriglobales bacterium]|nr:signal recognition particle-docking protein FtsY [Terriglobales bacterium]